MRGHVRKRGERWQAMHDIDRDPTGRRRMRSKTFDTRSEAQRWLTTQLQHLNAGTYVEPSKATLGDYLTQEWLPAAKLGLRASTWASYRIYLNCHVIPHLGGVRLANLTPGRINALYADLLAGTSNQQPLAPKTVRNLHGVLHKSLADAVAWGLLLRNPADHAEPPRSHSPEMSTWDDNQLRTFLASVSKDRLYAAWLLFTTTGMRRGEVLGLRWDDLDFERSALAVRQTLIIVDRKLTISEPKTRKGRRTIALDPATVAELRSHRARQLEERLAAGPGWVDSGLVFTCEDGSLLSPDRVTKRFAQRAKRAGLPAIRLHDLRHSWATAALRAGVHPKIVSERLGHSTIAITLDTYSHVLPSMDADAAATVAQAILGPITDTA